MTNNEILFKLYGEFFAAVDLKMAICNLEVGKNMDYETKVPMINDLTKIIDKKRAEIRAITN